MRFFEVKVKVDRMMSSGAMKNVSEIYAVDAMTFTEAEARTTECVHTETEGVFEVIAEKRAKYDEVVFNDGEMFFLVKFILITYNDGGNERRNPKFVLFRAESIDKAKEHAREHMRLSFLEYEIEYIKETKIVDVLLNCN